MRSPLKRTFTRTISLTSSPFSFYLILIMGASSRFCCCLPLRLGSVLIAVCQLLISLGSAGLFWYILYYISQTCAYSYSNDFTIGMLTFTRDQDGLGTSQIPLRLKITTGLFASVQTLAFISSLFGFVDQPTGFEFLSNLAQRFVGTLRAKYSWVKQFASMMAYLLGISIVMGIVSGIFSFSSSSPHPHIRPILSSFFSTVTT